MISSHAISGPVMRSRLRAAHSLSGCSTGSCPLPSCPPPRLMARHASCRPGRAPSRPPPIKTPAGALSFQDFLIPHNSTASTTPPRQHQPSSPTKPICTPQAQIAIPHSTMHHTSTTSIQQGTLGNARNNPGRASSMRKTRWTEIPPMFTTTTCANSSPEQGPGELSRCLNICAHSLSQMNE